jgi:isocitrate dehydrogenase
VERRRRAAGLQGVIPDSSYAGVYQAVIDDCKAHGAFDPATMGSVPNVGLMAQKAEEYGSHDKTFEIAADGTCASSTPGGRTCCEHAGRGRATSGARARRRTPRPRLGEARRQRARATGAPAVFWLDRDRAHDAELIAKVERYLGEHDTSGLEIRVLAPAEAMRFSLERIRRGEDTISVTGNVLRDYLTDLFPILEIGTSARCCRSCRC